MADKLLRNLHKELRETEGEYDNAKRLVTEYGDKCKQLKTKIVFLKGEIEKYTTGEETRVSEHARIRFIERVHGINIDDIDENILTDKVKEWISVLGDGDYPLSDNKHYAKVVNGVVVTIYPAK